MATLMALAIDGVPTWAFLLLGVALALLLKELIDLTREIGLRSATASLRRRRIRALHGRDSPDARSRPEGPNLARAG